MLWSRLLQYELAAPIVAPPATVCSSVLGVGGHLPRYCYNGFGWARLWPILAAAVVLGSPSLGQCEPPGHEVRTSTETESLEAQLRRLRETVDELSEQISEVSEDASDQARLIHGPVQLHLYTQAFRFEAFEGSDGHSFVGKTVELFAVANMSERFRLLVEIEFERAAAVGGSRGGSIDVEQVQLDFTLVPELGLRAGVLPVPFGYFNQHHYSFLNELNARPLMAKAVAPATWADVGIGAFGTLEISEDYEAGLDYQLVAINGLGEGISSTSMRGARQGFGQDNNKNRAVVGRIALTIGEHEFAASGYFGKYDDAGERVLAGAAGDLELRFGAFELLAEVAYFSIDAPTTGAGPLLPQAAFGGYVQGAYRFWPVILDDTLLGFQDGSNFAVVMRLGRGEFGFAPESGLGPNRETRVTFGLNYRPVPQIVFRWEYQINSGLNGALVNGDNDGFIFGVGAGF